VPAVVSTEPKARPFHVAIPEATIERILIRLRDTRRPAAPSDDADWRYGTDMGTLEALVAHWTSAYDWRSAEREINRHPQFHARIDGGDIHFVHVRGSGARPLPLVLTHGWPGSFHEYHKLIEPLCFPERFGGDPDDGFDLVIPSLPGFGFSSAPPRPIGLRKVARLWHVLMRDVLGYRRYGAQGGDMGSAVSMWLALDEPEHLLGIHLNLFTMAAADAAAPQSDEERVWAQALQGVQQREMAYAALHATRPQTVALALADNPVGVAAWMLEKFQRWSDVGSDLWARYSRDEMITAIMVYLVSDSMPSALWMYRGAVEEGSGVIPVGQRVRVPTACAVFPKEFLPCPPRSRVERSFNVVRWTEMTAGGHFPALEEPQALATDVRAFFRELGRAPRSDAEAFGQPAVSRRADSTSL
jgi:pimeloyl-ACP methyl ester carboxylesterase